MLLLVGLHPLYDPLARHLGILLERLLILHSLLDVQRLGHVATFLDTGSLAHHLLPLLQRWELVDVHAGPSGPDDPSDRGDVRDRDVIAHDEPGL